MKVNVDNFVRAETDRMFADLQRDAGGVNRFLHNRAPAAVERQTVIRLNRDTLYSFAVVDLSEGATLSMPDPGTRYVSAMVVNQDHYVNRVIHEPGEHHLTMEDFDTPYVVLAIRTLANPRNEDDLSAVATLQDRLRLQATAARPFVSPSYDVDSLDRTRSALLSLAAGMDSFGRSFGRREDVDPVHHLISTAAGWGGLPDAEAAYVGVAPDLPVGEYTLTVGDVPVDGFWSISVYNADGYFVPNDRDAVSIINVTAVPGPDGSVTVHFGGCSDDRANCLPIMEGWNYLVRLYRPRPEVLDGSWTFPGATPLS